MSLNLPVYLTFILVSMTSFLPFNLFMNAHEYFYYKLRNVSHNGSVEEWNHLPFSRLLGNGTHSEEAPTELQRNYEGWFALIASCAVVLGQVGNLLTTTRLSNKTRVMTGHALTLLTLSFTIFYTFINTDKDQVHFFVLSVLLSSVCSLGAMGFIGAGILGLSARFPPVYMQAVLIGLPLAGVLSCILSILVQISTTDPVLNGQIYFGVAAMMTTLSGLCYLLLFKSEFVKQQLDINNRLALLAEAEEEPAEEDENVTVGTEVDGVQMDVLQETSTFQKFKLIALQGSDEMILAGSVLAVTLSVFPAVTALVVSQSRNQTWKKFFIPVCCFLLFNIGDSLGRILANRIQVSRATLPRLCWLRLCLLPLILACDIVPRYHSPSFIHSDTVFAGLIVALSVSNGFCITVASVRSIMSVEASLRESAGGVLAVLCGTISLLGSIVGVALVAIL